MKEDTIEILRIVRYIGPRALVEEQIKKSLPNGEKELHNGMIIQVSTVGDFPRIIGKAYVEQEGE